MHDIVYHQCASTFDTHWWSHHRRALVSRLLSVAGVEADGTRSVLEIACGPRSRRFAPMPARSLHRLSRRPPIPFVDRVLRGLMALERLLIRLHPLPVRTCWAVVVHRRE
jgi:hypothetical protein